MRSFVASMESRADRIDLHAFPAASVRPFHVTEWVDARPRWGPNHKRGAIIAVQRAFSWAAKADHIETSPVRGVEKPPPKRREQVLTRGEFDALLAHVAALMSHSNAVMVSTTYSHMDQAKDFLWDELKRASGGAAAWFRNS